MAPEVYMVINDIAFTYLSVSGERNALVECFKPEALEEIRKADWKWLEIVFQCPPRPCGYKHPECASWLRIARHRGTDGTAIHEIIDSILAHSSHKGLGQMPQSKFLVECDNQSRNSRRRASPPRPSNSQRFLSLQHIELLPYPVLEILELSHLRSLIKTFGAHRQRGHRSTRKYAISALSAADAVSRDATGTRA
jgi:hypothetical protein